MGRTLHIRVDSGGNNNPPLRGGVGAGARAASGPRDAGNKDENIAAFIAVLIIKSIKYGREEEERAGKNSRKRGSRDARTHRAAAAHALTRALLLLLLLSGGEAASTIKSNSPC